jgi:hypothetical protein
MKNNIYLHFATALLIAAVGITASAQARNQQQLHVNVPFDFNVGSKALPAGEYNVSIVNPSASSSVLKIASLDGRFTAMTRTTDIIGWSSTSAKLTFRHYGARYFLAEVWMESESTGLATPRSSSEKTLQRQLGNAATKYDVVAVNARS